MTDGRDAFTAFVVDHERRLLALALLLTGDRGLAEDLLQTALLTTYRHWGRVSRAESPLAYVRRVLINTHLSWRRRLMSTEQVLEVLPDPGGPDPQAAHAVEADLRRALAELSPRVRAVLVLRYFEDLTERETAKLLGCSTSTVSTHAARGLATLRRTLAPADDGAVASPRKGRS